MGKATMAAKKERLEKINSHIEWSKEQTERVLALAQFADGCSVYAPAATAKVDGEFDHSWVVEQTVMVPDLHCEEQVVIPANYVKLFAGKERGHIVNVGVDPFAATLQQRRYAALSPNLKVTLPGGRIALMAKTDGKTVIHDPNDPEAEAAFAEFVEKAKSVESGDEAGTTTST